MKKTITVKQAVELFNFLSSLDKKRDDVGNVVAADKNRITDRQVRAAVIDNIIALLPVKNAFAQKYKELQKQYFTDSYTRLLRSRAEIEQTNDNVALANINKAIKEEESTFAEEYNASFKKIMKEEVEVNLVEIDRDRFDEATEGDCGLPLKVYIDFNFIFSNNRTEDGNEKD